MEAGQKSMESPLRVSHTDAEHQKKRDSSDEIDLEALGEMMALGED